MKTEEVLPEYGADGTSMPRWKCHKEVSAFQIREIRMVGEPAISAEQPRAVLVSTDGGSVVVTAEYMRKHRPQIGGYYVLYEDGYHSFSPAKAFEDGYTRIPTTPPTPIPGSKRTSCNRHDDCDKADKSYLSVHTNERFTPANFHCHNDECEDCFRA